MQIKHIQHKQRKIRQIPTELNYYTYLAKQQKKIIKQVAINRLIGIGLLLSWLIAGIYKIISYQLWINTTIGA